MKNQLFFLVVVLFFVNGCVQLTPAGQRVQLLAEHQEALVASCKFLATVSVSSRDALRNATASLSGDTALMSARDVGITQYIKGDVYDCSASAEPAFKQAQEERKREPTSQEKADAEYVRKSTLCQGKGGAWIANQCVIAIE